MTHNQAPDRPLRRNINPVLYFANYRYTTLFSLASVSFSTTRFPLLPLLQLEYRKTHYISGSGNDGRQPRMKREEKRSPCLYDCEPRPALEENSISFHASVPISFDRSLLRTYGFRAGGLLQTSFRVPSLVSKGDREIPQVVPSTANACVCSFRLVHAYRSYRRLEAMPV